MIIKAKGLSYSYGNEEVLNDFSFDFKENKLYSIIGPNGCGKSTLLKCLFGYLSPKSGNVSINSKNIASYSTKHLAKKISYVQQSTNTSFDFSVKDIVTMGRHPYLGRFSSLSKTDKDHIKFALKSTSTYDFRHKSINELSGGEKQRAFIARALAQDTDIVLLDEPVSMLDINHQIEIMDTVKHLSKNLNKTVICVLHDLNLASSYGDEIILMEKSKIFTHGTPNDVITKENLEKVYKVGVTVEKINKNKIFIMPNSNLP